MLFIDTCPECKVEYINDDDVAGFKWYCSERCREVIELRKKDITIPEARLFENINDDETGIVFEPFLDSIESSGTITTKDK
jgi:hypothetical protein